MKTSKASKKAMMLALLLVVSCIDASPASSFSFDMPSENVYSVDHCPPGQKLVEKPEGSFCMKDLSYLWDDGQGQVHKHAPPIIFPTTAAPAPTTTEPLLAFVYLPADSSQLFTPEEDRCFSEQKIYWSPDGHCYPLLIQGPCQSDSQWLALEESKTSSSSKKIKVSCLPRPCPCLASDPDMCEVLLKQENNQSCRNCFTALAAEQNGLCGQGQQFFNSPFGFGICGCRAKPNMHVKWPLDGKCYPLYDLSSSPCSYGQTLHWDSKTEAPLCVTSVCPQGLVLAPQDGKCYSLGSQGPCVHPEDEYVVDPVSLQPKCLPRQNAKVKRIFDVLPSNMQKNGLGMDAAMLSCLKRAGNSCLTGSGNGGGGGGARNSLLTIADPRMGKRFNGAWGQQKARSNSDKAVAYLDWLLSFAEN